jgi:hypothetical protein
MKNDKKMNQNHAFWFTVKSYAMFEVWQVDFQIRLPFRKNVNMLPDKAVRLGLDRVIQN